MLHQWVEDLFDRQSEPVSLQKRSNGYLNSPGVNDIPLLGREGIVERQPRLSWSAHILSTLFQWLFSLFPSHRNNLEISTTSSLDDLVLAQDANANIRPAALHQLPDELLVDIMKQSTPLSIWSLRQVPPFFRLFCSEDFCELQGEPGPRDRCVRFSRAVLTTEEQQEAVDYLQRDKPSLCDPCAQVRARGEEDPKLSRLRKLRFCEGCKENHAGIFFPSDKLDAYDKGVSKLTCIGRLGEWKICNHSSASKLVRLRRGDTLKSSPHNSITWDSLGDELRDKAYKNEVLRVCKHPSHGTPRIKTTSELAKRVSTFPRLHTQRLCHKSSIYTTYGWDVAFLEIDQARKPRLEDLRRVILSLLKDHFRKEGNPQCCHHLLDSGDLLRFTGLICACFIDKQNTHYSNISESMDSTCRCGRELALECDYCGGMYLWQVIEGNVFLSYRCGWRLSHPTNPGWLALLGNSGMRLLDESNKHLLWCDDPSCLTSKEDPWMDLVKEEIMLQYHRFNAIGGLESLKEENMNLDCEMIVRRRMRQKYGLCYESRTKDLLEAIRAARFGELPTQKRAGNV